MVYTLETIIKHPDALINIEDNKGRIVNFFVNNKGDGKFLNYKKVSVQVLSGYDKNNILETDFFGTALGIPLFSEIAKNILQKKLIEEMIFYQSELLINGKIINCYLGKIIKSSDIINKEKSVFRISSTGSKFLVKPISNELINKSFFITKDIEYPTYFYVSDKFKELAENNNLNIDFNEK
ncbi:hypothetical protein LNI88_11770 [Tenacibaculum dicentrarchi]|uniref:hypothetical protein n=1 Tax=Tenacibaculum finnmarkense TaxID=2781243 RepID=UPI001E3F84E4|nr:hypothetical protein [Tenacibaculum finnmarkense]MCD8406222.1 hypothetical protein [Tenacibaculum dicentrarchi]MCD8425985.1 hypothetical protein [Tenacibaculum dicentrarchi]MCD8443268.1 hypothetical protein [Tenacibaculum dicentrarchi]WCC46200.1 hypothetical protein PJH08_07260 [Tenacibaculum finnmarkense]